MRSLESNLGIIKMVGASPPRIFQRASILSLLFGRFRAFFASAYFSMQIFVALQGLRVLRLYLVQLFPQGGYISAGLPASAARVGWGRAFRYSDPAHMGRRV